MKLGNAAVIQADARSLPLDDASVDLIVTSPPYFALRSYTDAGEHYAGQIGSEDSPGEFLDALLEVTRECVRVLKPSGSLWVNLGDKYAQAEERSRNGNGNRKAIDNFTSGAVLGKSCNRCGADAPQNPCPYSDVPCEPRFTREKTVTLGRKDNGGVPRKSLIGIPWRYALRCIDDLGLILRAEVIWSKPNGLPESVTDRVRRSHEQWFHFTREPRYFSAVDEIREPHAEVSIRRAMPHRSPAGRRDAEVYQGTTGQTLALDQSTHPLGKLPGSVWTDEPSGLEANGSLIRSVLAATAAGALTIEEGERLLWTGTTNSGRRSNKATTWTAGDGSASTTATATDATGRPAKATAEHTGSSTNPQSAPSPRHSPSTTCAATGGASTPRTSSPSPSAKTADADLGPSAAQPDTLTTSRTHTSDATASESADDAWLSELGSTTDAPPSVWQVATEPLRVPDHLGVDHFAAFPTEWPKRIIQAWSPAGGVVLDPFGGTGTTALVAKALGRHGITVDMSADYCRVAAWRTNDRNQLAKVLSIGKAGSPSQEESLLDLLEDSAS